MRGPLEEANDRARREIERAQAALREAGYLPPEEPREGARRRVTVSVSAPVAVTCQVVRRGGQWDVEHIVGASSSLTVRGLLEHATDVDLAALDHAADEAEDLP